MYNWLCQHCVDKFKKYGLLETLFHCPTVDGLQFSIDHSGWTLYSRWQLEFANFIHKIRGFPDV